MTQKIFDTDNADDMALLWSILPESITKLTPTDTFCITSDTYTFRGGIIKIDFHDKREITYLGKSKANINDLFEVQDE